MRLLPASREILRVLTICPWMPVEVLVALVGARSRVSVYQILARLAAAGLVQKRQAWVGPSPGNRPTALWSTTTPGQHALDKLAPKSPTPGGEPQGQPPIASESVPSRPRVADPVRIAAARALAGWLAEQRAAGQSVRLEAWKAPLVQQLPLMAGRRLRLPAAARVEFAGPTGAHAEQVIVVPDLGTAPIARLRPMLLRLFGSLADVQVDGSRAPTRLFIATTNVDGTGARRLAWLQLIQRLESDTGVSAVPKDILEWPQVYGLLGLHTERVFRGGVDRAGQQWSTRGRRADEILDLLGRHPLLTVKQLADLLALTPRRARQLRQSLVKQGLVRLFTTSELGPRAPVSLANNRWAIGDLAELTAAGRRRVACRLGLPVAAARRYHGLFGGSRRHRQRALRHLAHTVGANQVFVTMAVAVRVARARGADDALEEWRPAAACEHWRCKPDGYGCYRRGDQRFGFLLEYDRGTERARQYDAKLAAFYAYYTSGQAARRYASLPYVLFITESDAAETRIIAAIERAFGRGGEVAFRFLTTSTARIEASGLLGAIWRRPLRHVTEPSPGATNLDATRIRAALLRGTIEETFTNISARQPVHSWPQL